MKVALGQGMERPEEVNQARWSSPQRIRLLLVEDELSTAFAMREFFALYGYDIDCASGLNEAAVLIDRSAYHAVITDLHLTTSRCSEGMMIAAAARRRNPHACIVMLTGYGSEATEEEALRCGVDMYQTKPVELASLSAFVDLTLRRDQENTSHHVVEKWQRH